MAEGHQERLALLITTQGTSYVALRMACETLPIPLLLPEVEDDTDIDTLAQALHQAAVTVGDQPIGQLVKTALSQALLGWIAASVQVEAYDIIQSPPYYAAAYWLTRQVLMGAELAIHLLAHPEEQE